MLLHGKIAIAPSNCKFYHRSSKDGLLAPSDRLYFAVIV
jgi:hypothetical protein